MFQKSDSTGSDRVLWKTLRRSLTIRDKDIEVILENAGFTKGTGGPETDQLLDEAKVDQLLRGVAAAFTHNVSAYNPLPDRIVVERRGPGAAAAGNGEPGGQSQGGSGAVQSRGKQRREVPFGGAERTSPQGSGGTSGMLEAYEPRWSLEDVYLNEASRAHIESALTMIRQRAKLFEDWGLRETHPTERAVALNFYGPPGTGKSMAAEAIAGALGKRVLLVNYAELESKFVGDTPKNVRMAFETATRGNAVLIFDEADSFLGKRLTKLGQASDYGVNITRSVLLMELERFEGVVVFTTNLLRNYDDAFRRRILAQVPFGYPDEGGRAELWERYLPDRLPLQPGVTALGLAASYPHLTGADIKDMVLFASASCLQQGGEQVGAEHFELAYRYIKQRYAEQEGEAGAD